MNDTPLPDAPGTPGCCASGKPRCPCVRWLPVLLLAAAAVLYLRDVRVARRRADAAAEVRKTVAVPLVGVALAYRLEGRQVPFLIPLSPTDASNLVFGVGTAKPTRFPRGAVAGEELEVHLFQTNHVVTVLQAALLERDPDTLYLRARRPAPTAQAEDPTSWTVTLPAKVPGLGPLVRHALDALKAQSDALPAEADFLDKLTNAAAHATGPAAETTPAPVRAGDAEVPAPAVGAALPEAL